MSDKKLIGYTWTQADGKHRSIGAAPHPTAAHNIEPIYYPLAATQPSAAPALPDRLVQAFTRRGFRVPETLDDAIASAANIMIEDGCIIEHRNRKIAAPGDGQAEARELLAYVLQDEQHNRLTPRVIDIAYTAFMLAKQPNAEDGGSSDWFNDTRPAVQKAIEKMRKDFAALAAPSTATAAREQEQRERMNVRFANRPASAATADFDLPAASDAVAAREQAISAVLYPMERFAWTEEHVKTYPRKAAAIINAALASGPEAPAAPSAEPLSEATILKLHLDWTGDVDAKINFARAVEAAHGIASNPQSPDAAALAGMQPVEGARK